MHRHIYGMIITQLQEVKKKNEKCDFKRMKNVTLDAPPLSPFVTFAMPTSTVQCSAHRWNLPLFRPVDLLNPMRILEQAQPFFNSFF